VTVLLFQLLIQAANASVMHNSDQLTFQLPYLPDQKSLMLGSRSFSQWGSDRAAGSIAYKSCQYVGYAELGPNHYSITVLTIPKIIDAQMTLIFRTWQ